MKTADDCTYEKMVQRFREESHRHGDERTIYNMHAFMRDFAGMEEGETIREFEQRTGNNKEAI